MEIQTLERKSIEYRRSILRIIKLAKAGHTGGSLSCVDILNVLYNQVLNVSPQNFNDPDRDRFIQSKGHSVEALYVVLAERGFISNEQLETIEQYQSDLIGHPSRKVPGIEHNTGALGHGLSVAVGMALAAKKDKRAYRVFALLGDGELTEGSGWEAAMSASHYGLDNLTAIVDRNGLQITGKTEMVMRLEPLVDKYTAFGFAVREVDGNNLAALSEIFKQLPFVPGKPSLVLAHTVKGKGISFIENQVNWHHRVPTDEEYATAMKELDQAEKEWQIRYANTING